MPRRSTPDPYTLQVGARIREMRQERGLSLAELADASALSKGHLSSVEHGLAAITIHTITRLAEGLGVSPGSLLPSTSDALSLSTSAAQQSPRTRTSLRPLIPTQPIILEKLHLQHVRGLHDLELEFAPPSAGKGQWIVLLGRNGTGKTTLLKAMCLMLRNLGMKVWPKDLWSTPWREIGQTAPATMTIKIAEYGQQVTTIYNGNQEYTQIPEPDEAHLFPIFAYGCRRGSVLGREAEAVRLDEEDGLEIATLFDEGAGLVHAETWLKERALEALQDPKNARPVYDAIVSALRQLLDVQDVSIETSQVYVTEKSGRKILFAAQSDGYLTTVGWFLDLIARWIALCTKAGVNIRHDFLMHMRGLVLIDEIDLHLHPSWQVESIRRTRELMPEMSFVVTTHNPLTLGGAKPEEIFQLKDSDGHIVADRGEDLKGIEPVLKHMEEGIAQKVAHRLQLTFQHILNRPVGMLRQSVQEIREGLDEQTLKKLASSFDDVDKQLNHLADLAQKIRLWQEDVEGTLEDISLLPFVNNVTRMFTERNSGVLIETMIDESIVVHAMDHALREVLYNLVENAIHAVLDTALDVREVKIRAHSTSNTVIIEIEDSGTRESPCRRRARSSIRFIQRKKAGEENRAGPALGSRSSASTCSPWAVVSNCCRIASAPRLQSS
jgi:transcriptional regulator with XRE-family HTH domain/signal transduction histidine kinase